MCKFLICMIDAYKCILRMMSQIRRRWLWTCWYTDGLIRGGYGRIRRIDGLILMLPPKGKGFFLYTHLCVHPFIYLLYFFISMFIYLYILIYICRSISKYTLYIISIYLFASILSLQPYTHLHIYQSFYVSTYMYLFPYESTYLCL